ncbi:MAG: adenine deaminase, partial [Limisphaerales bacterium]
PKANIYIENQLPNYALWKDFSERILVGTDSLASNDRLSILDELIEIAVDSLDFDPTELVQFACWNAARFFGWEAEFGAFEKGMKPGINLITEAENGNPIGRGSTLIKIA